MDVWGREIDHAHRTPGGSLHVVIAQGCYPSCLSGWSQHMWAALGGEHCQSASLPVGRGPHVTQAWHQVGFCHCFNLPGGGVGTGWAPESQA